MNIFVFGSIIAVLAYCAGMSCYLAWHIERLTARVDALEKKQ